LSQRQTYKSYICESHAFLVFTPFPHLISRLILPINEVECQVPYSFDCPSGIPRSAHRMPPLE